MNKNAKSKLKIIPLGGMEQIGMNITAFEYEDSIIVVDCGLAFPENDMLGIDLVIPDTTYLKENIDKVKGFFITHGHEDHIGAIPFVLRDINVPIYATKLTVGLIENKLDEYGMVGKVKCKVVKYGQHINIGCFRVEFIRTNHSIQDAAALAIYSPAGIVVHTGDFKVDYTPVYGDAIDLARFGEIGKKGVLALMCDSTNAERSGFTQSEKSVGSVLDKIFDDHRTQRIIIATFASNVDRVEPMNYFNALKVVSDVLQDYPDIYIVNEGANALDNTRNVINMYHPRLRLDTGTWGVMGIGMGYSIGASVTGGKQVLAIEGDSAFGFSGMEIETICRYRLPVTVLILNNGGIYRGDEKGHGTNGDPAPTMLMPEARYDRMIEAFGGKAYHVTSPEELDDALSSALASKSPCLINCVIDPSVGLESGHIGNLNPHSSVK